MRVLRVVQIRETASRMVIARDRGEGRMGSYCIVDVELQPCTIKEFQRWMNLSSNEHVLDAT